MSEYSMESSQEVQVSELRDKLIGIADSLTPEEKDALVMEVTGSPHYKPADKQLVENLLVRARNAGIENPRPEHIALQLLRPKEAHV